MRPHRQDSCRESVLVVVEGRLSWEFCPVPGPLVAEDLELDGEGGRGHNAREVLVDLNLPELYETALDQDRLLGLGVGSGVDHVLNR